MAAADAPLAHRLRRMAGRDPHEDGRASTPLELLFNLTFVVAVGQAANLFAHLVAEGHVGSGLIGFAFATFAVSWAWVAPSRRRMPGTGPVTTSARINSYNTRRPTRPCGQQR